MIISKNVTPKPKKKPKSPAVKKSILQPKEKTAIKSPGVKKDILEVKEIVDGNISRSHVSAVVRAAVKLSQRDKKQKSNLFGGDGKGIHIQIGGIKVPKESRSHMLKCNLPHEVCSGSLGVALFVKDLTKDFKEDHEPTVHHFNELLSSKNSHSLISEVIPLRGLKSEYQTFELKRRLSNKYDKFLADKRIINRLPRFLGKFFYSARKIPIPVDLEARNLNEEIKRALHTSILPLNHKGMSSILTMGSTAMKMGHVVDNIMKFIEILKVKYPGGWANIRSLHIKTDSSPSVPLHISTVSVKDLGYVDAQKPKRKMRKPEVDELSTLPGASVKVLADGTIKVKREVDPNWDMKYKEPLISGSEDEDDEANKEENEKKDMKTEKDKSKMGNSKKRGRSAQEAEDIPSKKFKKTADDEDESEDEQMYLNELNFMKKMAQEEEEMERKNKEAPADDEVDDSTKVVVDQEGDEDDDDMEESVVDDICLKDTIPLQGSNKPKIMKISRKEKNKNGKSKKQRVNESKSKSAKKSGSKPKISGKKSPAASFKTKKGKK